MYIYICPVFNLEKFAVIEAWQKEIFRYFHVNWNSFFFVFSNICWEFPFRNELFLAYSIFIFRDLTGSRFHQFYIYFSHAST
ncbi:hypothetical protein HHI36_017081 [Cryptolaemus montrouzieri]|uniref:Uncharacterized protein n=1 Tax=Cryptolaemus montrouzieri TaxID=559131 RepID=A0ABD2NLZ6_9CUCU